MSSLIEIDTPASGAVPNAPEISPETLENKETAIRDDAQAFAVVHSIINDNKDRIELSAKIAREIDGIEPPLDPSELEETGKDYKSNINTGFLQTVVNKVAPRLVNRIKKIPSLTNSKLAENAPDSIRKTQHFRKTITKTIRSWKRWHTTLQALAFETSSYGYCFPSFTNPFDWQPVVYRTDRAFIPNDTQQLDDNYPFFVIKESFKVDQLFKKIKDKDAAEAAGWDIKNTVDAINKAHPRREEDGNPREKARDFEDLKREVVSSAAFEEGTNVVKCFHLFALEVNGKVSQKLLCDDTKKELFSKDERYDSMSNVTIPFTFQYGNGSIHGSYGIGHLIYDISINIEETRNATIDALRNLQKFIIQVDDESELTKAKLLINDDAIYSAVGTFAGDKGALPASVEASLSLDRNLVARAEEKVGAFLPDPTPTEDETATKTQVEAAKDLETKEAILDHFLTHFGYLITEMQRRLVDPNVDDKLAVQCRKELLEVLDKEEIQEIANTPAILTTADFTGSKDIQNVQFLESRQGNPAYRQNQLENEISNIMVGPDMTERVFIPEDDQTETIEAARLQQFETKTMMTGEPVPVSPRDNDLVHMGVMRGDQDPETGEFNGALPQAAEGANQGAEDPQIAQILLDHYQSHVTSADSKDLLGEQLNSEKKFISDMQAKIEAGLTPQQSQI